jgi:hypothetical protein
MEAMSLFRFLMMSASDLVRNDIYISLLCVVGNLDCELFLWLIGYFGVSYLLILEVAISLSLSLGRYNMPIIIIEICDR